MEFKLSGVVEVRAKLRGLTKQNPALAAKALNEVAELTMTDSLELVPVKTGRLKGTGKVMPHATPISLMAQLNYGTDYALYVHEVFARHFPPYGTGGKWKYLEDAVNIRSRTFGADIATRLGVSWRRLVR